MEDGTPVQLVEEETLGWTIVSRREDDELQVADRGQSTSKTKEAYEEDAGKIRTERAQASPGYKANLEQEGWEEAFRGCEVSEKGEGLEEGRLEEKEEEEVQYEEEQAEGEEEEEEEKMADVQRGFGAGEVVCRSARRNLPWGRGGEQVRERKRIIDGKQTLVQKQSQKHPAGLLWRVSLMATLGFFGWAVLSSAAGAGGRNFRSLKTHPCNFKEGEPVLNPRIEN